MQQIEKTRNYGMFKFLIGNRPLRKPALRKLKLAIEYDNQLGIHPIIVNNNLEVIDGQHRLEVAKELGVDIYYIKSDSVKDDHLISCNVNQLQFDCANYIEFFAIKHAKPDYRLLIDYMKKSGLQPKALLTLLLGHVSTAFLDFLKRGNFKFPEGLDHSILLDHYMNFKEYCIDKRIKPFSMFTNHNFTKGFRMLYQTQGFDEEKFYGKLDNRWFELKPQHNPEDWYKLLLGIYNYKSKERLIEISEG